jgi:KRAB domain-containing zinc finger protein
LLSISGRISRDYIFQGKEYFCGFCEKHYLGRRCFKGHFKTHFTIFQDKHACLICDFSAKTVSHINRHILETHFMQQFEAEKLFVCTVCNKRFDGQRDLVRHTFTHTGEGMWKCGECEYSCAQKYRLESHMCAVHELPKQDNAKKSEKNDLFICDNCNYFTRDKSSLIAHIKRHIGHKSYECPECSYRSTSGGDLRKHRTIHSDERPFVCDRCSKTFKRRSHLIIHVNAKYGCQRRKKRNTKSENVN